MAAEKRMRGVKEGAPTPVKRPLLDDPESLAEAIRNISAGMRRLIGSGLNRKAIVVLLKDSTGQPKHVIEQVLDHLDELSRKYTSR